MKFRWELTIDAVTTEVQPINTPELTMEAADDDLFLYYFRPKLSSLVFKKDDYQLLKDKLNSPDPCEDIILDVTRICGGADEWTEQFIFSIHDCKFNDDKCTVEVEVECNDNYRCVKLNWDKKQNILSAPTERISNFRFYDSVLADYCGYTLSVEFYVTTNGGAAPTGDGWDASTRLLSATIGANDYDIYTRYVVIVDCEFGTVPAVFDLMDWAVVFDDCSGSGVVKLTMVNDCNTGIPPVDLLSLVAGNFDETSTPVPTDFDAVLIGNEVYSGYYLWYDQSGFSSSPSIPNGRPFDEVMELLLEGVCDTLTLRSEFMQINPDTVTEISPLTGLYNYYQANRITIHAVSDVANFDAAQAATREETTLKKMLEWLRDKLRVFPSFDGNILILEHESMYGSSVIYDASSLVGLNNYSFDLSGVPQRMNYSEPHTFTADFIGLPMTYGPACTNRDEQDVTITGVTTDLLNVFNNESLYESDGLVMLCSIEQMFGTEWVIFDTGALSGFHVQNAPLSWANVHRDLHRHNRPLITGYMNGELVNHQSSIRIKQQENVWARWCCSEVLESGLVTTELGNGYTKSMKVNMLTGKIEFVLMHEQILTT